MQAPRFVFKLLKLGPQIAYAVGLGPLIGHAVLLLTTTGRKSGKQRVTPLQYEEVTGNFLIGSARGEAADWYRNLEVDPHVEIRVKDRHIVGIAEPCADPKIVADFLAMRLKKHPRTMRRILRSQGYHSQPTHEQLLDYAQNRTMVTIREIRE